MGIRTQDLVINVASSQTMFCETHAKFNRATDAALSLPQTGMAPPNGIKSLERLCIYFPCSGLRAAGAAQDSSGCWADVKKSMHEGGL